MTQNVEIRSGPDWHKIQQGIKWAVYALLIVNFVFYVFEDITSAVHTLTARSTFLDWTGTFATSIDESAWFLLLAMYEKWPKLSSKKLLIQIALPSRMAVPCYT